MPSLGSRRPVLAFAALLIALVLTAAVPPRLEPVPQFPSLMGQLLIAAPGIGDPRFRRTVILIVRHSKDGAFGLTINRPLGVHTLASLLAMLGEADAAATGEVQLFAGGPVQPQAAFVVHTADYQRPETLAIDGHIAVTSTLDVLRDLAHQRGPQKSLVALGYAGWAAGQLEAERARDDWFTAPADLNLVFDESRERVWDAAMARRTRDL